MRSTRRGQFGLVLVLFSCCWSLLVSSLAQAAERPLRMASFNVQVFGQAKMKKEAVVNTLVKIFDRYDLVFLMEIRDSEDTAVNDLLERLNKSSSKNYGMVLSERLGRSSSKEQYAYIYDEAKISVDRFYVAEDSGDRFEREPYVAHFRTAKDSFAMIGIHVTPGDVENELRELSNVYTETKRKHGSSDIFIVGDLNADCNYYDTSQGFNYFPDPVSLMTPDQVDTTVADTHCTYDRVLAFGRLPSVASKALPFNFEDAYNLDRASAQEVSDHFPVEWVFGQPVAGNEVDDSVLPNEAKRPDKEVNPAPAEQPSKSKSEAKVEWPQDETAGQAGSESKSCGLKPKLTDNGYCYAGFGKFRRRVSAQCCVAAGESLEFAVPDSIGL